MALLDRDTTSIVSILVIVGRYLMYYSYIQMIDVRVAVVGCPNVGKTSLCQYFSTYYGSEVRLYEEDVISYKYIHNLYLYDVVLCLYDTTNVDTLDEIREIIDILYGYMPIIVVGMKNDIISGILGGYTQSLPSDVDVVYVSIIDDRDMDTLLSTIINRHRDRRYDNHSNTPTYCMIL